MAAQFPTTFATERYQLGLGDIAPKHSMLLGALGRCGYAVEVGLVREDVSALTEIAGQPGTREYCPRDIEERWTNETVAEQQLGKDGGRGVFVLRNMANNAIAGFGWTGKSGNDEQKNLPMCENTFAIRLHEDSRGQGLAVPFSKIIVAGSMSIFRARRIGLETWASNNAAFNSYLKADAKAIKAINAKRPTLDTSKPFDEERGKHMTEDTRIYMNYGWSA